MILGDSIAALASPPGRSARAIIRLSGPTVPQALASLLDRAPTARGAFTARLALSADLSFPVPVLFFPAPASYTGEHAAELQLPGNPFLIERVLQRIAAIPGIRPAEPGEFSARAYLNGRLTVEQAEGVAAIVAAQTDDHIRAAHDLLAGKTGSSYLAWADELATLLALVEAGIDFTDQEDVIAIAPTALRDRLLALITRLDTHLGADAGRGVATALPRIALVGAPNAGKSTLFNALLSRRRAVTSPTAGTTRDVLAEELDLSRESPGTSPVILMDLAGLDGLHAGEEPDRSHAGDEPSLRGETAGFKNPTRSTSTMGDAPPSINADAQARARQTALDADLILLCDPSGRFASDEPWLSFIPANQPVLLVQTKADLPHPPPPQSSPLPDTRSPDLPTPDPLPLCALDGWNLPELRRRIAERVTTARAAGIAGLLPRHRLALHRFRDHLMTAADLIEVETTRLSSPELTAAALREGLDAIGELTGRISPDEVLGRVFASFCVGK